MYKNYIKRAIDFILALLASFILLPVIIVLSVLIKIRLGDPIIYKTYRIGKDEKEFVLYKFRTMTTARDEQGILLPDEKRLTKFGKILRLTSLDELPELINIIRGDMSIIGPRPLPTIYLPYYNNEERLRHSIRPGLTGLAQINGRNAIDWDKKFEYDIRYVREVSLLLDIKIFFQTINKVMKRSDIGVPGQDAPISLHIYRSKMSEKSN
mgnify:CR=1 FL=1